MATQDKNILKGLQSQVNKMKAEIDLDQSDLVNKQRLLSYKRKALKELKDKIDSFSANKELIVSEHAILRYLERVQGIDTDKVVASIKNDTIMGLYEKLGGNGKYPCDDFTAVISNNVVTTIITK